MQPEKTENTPMSEAEAPSVSVHSPEAEGVHIAIEVEQVQVYGDADRWDRGVGKVYHFGLRVPGEEGFVEVAAIAVDQQQLLRGVWNRAAQWRLQRRARRFTDELPVPVV